MEAFNYGDTAMLFQRAESWTNPGFADSFLLFPAPAAVVLAVKLFSPVVDDVLRLTSALDEAFKKIRQFC